jgi:hypothetical protein
MAELVQTAIRWGQYTASRVVMGVALLGVTAVPVMLHREPATDPARLLPVARPMNKSEFAKADPKRIGEIIPAIKLTACMFSQKTVRHHLRPAKVGFPACGTPGMQTSISEDLIDMTVSGIADVDGLQHPFTVTLQHNPPSVTEDGLIVTSIKD